MKRVKQFLLVAAMVSLFAACKKNNVMPGDPPQLAGELTLNGGAGGSGAENSVFVDLSASEQTAVKRDSWDLGFYSGDDFRVTLNNTLSDAMAMALNKNDLNAVTATDTIGMVLVNTYVPDDLNKVDDYNGDLSKTVIAQISANDADNKVYIYNRGSGAAAHTDGSEGWVKIRIIRKGNGYQLQYANIAATTFNTVDISKDVTHQFSYVSLDNGQEVKVVPAKGHWDFEWGFGAYYTAYGSSNIYYPSADLVFINHRDGVQVAEVLTNTVSYEGFDESHISELSFSAKRDAIGGNWRSVTQASSGVKTDRFYVVKDAAGNIYKLRFVSMGTADAGTRGYPQIEYKLVKEA